MKQGLFGAGLKLAVLALLSSLMLVPALLRAHEVRPSIADFTVTEAGLELRLRFNLEAFLVGVDLDAVGDINDSAQAQEYDRLRLTPGTEIAARAPELLEGWNALPLISIDGEPVTLRPGELQVDENVPLELPRTTQWVLTAEDLPANATSLTFAWPEGGGPLVLRQQGVEDPFTAYLNGGDVTEPIALGLGGWLTLPDIALLVAGLLAGLAIAWLLFFRTRKKP